ncbi:uncharacterized protein A1O9_09352 [Exophiala aquamarina CBS 119918]|uniref:Uncharacterized protein n=1 Tax=Exophiala aquamarina CBS 119918 TaxID=1182545 RepID=A0A072P490_9EURO|nr:uncharacterized protein A1O9_09352 [Exophiala aquamarina CBS 119918]KEF54909.1 hypothetical protein A1O9_09352 [Exophiala aquamarina CBS 119918]
MSPWNENTERKLLLCLIDPEKKPDWTVVSGNMGEGFTSEACRSFQILYNYHLIYIMPFKWDPVAERNLLLYALSEMQGPTASIWPSVADKLGGGLNANACSQKFYKLKKESESLLSGDGTTTPSKASTATPRGKTTKAKATGSDATPTKTPASGKRKQKASATDNNAATAPSKKIKQEVHDESEAEAEAAGTEESATHVKEETNDA